MWAEMRGDDVLDLRATRGSRGADQSYSSLGMETPVGAILSPTYIGTASPEPVTPLRVSVKISNHCYCCLLMLSMLLLFILLVLYMF